MLVKAERRKFSLSKEIMLRGAVALNFEGGNLYEKQNEQAVGYVVGIIYGAALWCNAGFCQ